MSGIRTQTSAADGKPLPLQWHMLPVLSKCLVEQRLMGYAVNIGHQAREVWMNLSHTDRERVKNHLQAKRQLNKALTLGQQYGMGAQRLTEYAKIYSGARQSGKSQMQEVILEARKRLTEAGRYSLYTPPNGGKRMLPSLYGRLRDVWVRKSGITVKPEDMNDGHLENSLKLLNESHGNTVARATELLGKMARHFQNQPGIVHMLTELCEAMQTVDVDEMYPIFKALADELQSRKGDNRTYDPLYFGYEGDQL